MSDYDYGNARLRAMKSRLLNQREYEQLIETDSLENLITTLSRTAYRRSIEIALARGTGIDCIKDALHTDLISTIDKIRRFYPPKEDELVAIVLHEYDLHNIKSILRGLSKHVTSGEILSTLLPVGELQFGLMIELARASGPRGVIDLMVSMGLKFAQPLVQLRSVRPGAELFEMELALTRWHQREAREQLKNVTESSEPLTSMLNLEADLTNLLTVLRFIHIPAEYKYLRQQIGSEDLTYLFIGPGYLSIALLLKVASQENLTSGLQILSDTRYSSIIQRGMERYARSGRLSEIEKSLRSYDLEWRARLIAADPLGIGVLVGYLALKTNEINNIRQIANQISVGMKADTIRSELEFRG